MADKLRPNFPRRLFWDVDPDTLDIDAHAAWVIVRVFERGDVEDIRMCRRYYGDERVREALLNTRFLSIGTHHLASAIYQRPLEAFRCYITRRSNQAYLPY
ncbi:MAG: hypothetical protein H6597_05490 [Flavobacteriales bacterium]|nr:hypothetical protein [Flavobacteriales bacterium]MCB9193968.1 hypothetical protein [Flavobacteriales bacterium]